MKSFLSSFLANFALLSLFHKQPQPNQHSQPQIETYDKYCYSTDKIRAQKKHFTLQTPHPKDDYIRPIIEGCTPRKIWMVSRHGTRYPSGNDINKLFSLPEIQSKITDKNHLCKGDYELLKKWNFNITTKMTPCVLTIPQGERDLTSLAISFKTMYPELFDPIYSPKTYTFGYANAQRCKRSLESFSKGLFGTGLMQWYSSIHWFPDNLMLRPWTTCYLYHDNDKQLSDSFNQMDIFMETSHYQGLVANVSRRLGTNKTLSYDDISIMWNECRYQQSYYLSKPSPWCAAFTLEHAKVLEYLGDLDLYYKYGYGNDNLNSKLSCASIKDLLHFMENESSPNKVTAYFSHAELLLLMLTAFGARNDSLPLLGSNYEQQKHRRFRASKMVPYAATISAVKYDCPNNQAVHGQRKILFLLNQKPLHMKWCAHGAICTLKELQDFYYNSTMRDCPNSICGPNFANLSQASNTGCSLCC